MIIRQYMQSFGSYLVKSGILLTIICFFQGCYSFKGTSIPANVNTFFVETITIDNYDAPFASAQTFSEKLRMKIRNESRLKYNESTPDIEFKGKLTGYRVTSVAPQNDQIPTANRLEVTISIEYFDNLQARNNWRSNFSFFKDFSNTANLIDVQDALLNDIFDQLTEDIFNKAFSNW